MDGQASLKLARLFRAGQGIASAEVKDLLSTLTPAERPQVIRAAQAMVSASAAAQAGAGGERLNELLFGAGWNMAAEGFSPSGGDDLTVRVPVRIDRPKAPSIYRTIKIIVDPATTIDDILSELEEIASEWDVKYPGSIHQILFNLLRIY